MHRRSRYAECSTRPGARDRAVLSSPAHARLRELGLEGHPRYRFGDGRLLVSVGCCTRLVVSPMGEIIGVQAARKAVTP